MPQDPYNSLVRRYFASPDHAGSLPGACSLKLTSEAADGAGNVVRLAAGIEMDTLSKLRFQALGCPHLIAAAEYFCRQYEGTAARTLQDFRPAETIRDLEIPVSKTGRILLLEDAIQLLWRKFSNSTIS